VDAHLVRRYHRDPDAVRAPDLLDRVQWPGHEVEVLHAFQTMNIDEVIYVGQGLVVRISRDRNDVEFGAR